MKSKQRFSAIFKALFHKRNIIIMSERSTAHLSMSGKTQFLIIAMLVGIIGTASYSTGRYAAAQQVIDEQGKTIKSVANSRIETNYNYGVPSLSMNNNHSGSKHTFTAPLTDPSYTFSTLDEGKLVARIAYLENRVNDLKRTNQDIVTVVRHTAAGQIKGLEEIIQHTSLSPDTLKRQAKQEKRIPSKPTASLRAEDGQGGPYIPAHWDEDMRQFVEDIENSADELYVLRKIMEIMPTDKPMTKNARYTSGFGHRRDPFTGRVAFHSGLDLASKTTPQIVATADGVVSIAERRGAYGKLVELKHGLGLSSRYGHLSRIMVKPGDKVKKGQVIGMQGSTGRSTGAHLHYEVRFNNRPLNPRGFLKAGDAYVQQN